MSVEARNGARSRTGGAGEHADRVKRLDEAAISIIIPTLDEARVIAALLAQLEPLRNGCEIVFVDGGSSDGTRDAILDAGFRLVDAPRGRGTQLNAGARASSGEILFFLHADSALPPDPLGEIRRAMRRRRVGCFGVRFEPSSPLMLCCRLLSNFRCYVRRIMFGDQGIFIDRDLFFEVGGFPDLPLMEDYQFSTCARGGSAPRRPAAGSPPRRVALAPRPPRASRRCSSWAGCAGCTARARPSRRSPASTGRRAEIRGDTKRETRRRECSYVSLSDAPPGGIRRRGEWLSGMTPARSAPCGHAARCRLTLWARRWR